MTSLYMTDGRVKIVHPANGAHWTLSELQALVGGYIQIVGTVDGRFMVINDNGKLEDLIPNALATRLYIYGREDYIAGPAVVVDTMLELDGPEDADVQSTTIH